MNLQGFSISTYNRKMGAIPSFSVAPGISCPTDAPCFKECYARRISKIYKNTNKAWLNNYNLLVSEGGYKLFEKTLNCFFDLYSPLYFRYNVGGDIFSVDYLHSICNIARKNKKIKFLVYTKQYNIINTYLNEHKKPSNLTIVFSRWLDYEMQNPYNFPVADYIPDKKQEIKEGFTCNNNCFECHYCWHMKKGQKVNFIKH